MTPETLEEVARFTFASYWSQIGGSISYSRACEYWDKELPNVSQFEKRQWIELTRNTIEYAERLRELSATVDNSSIPNPLENEYQWP